MADIGDVINGLSWPVKVGWVLWVVWVGAQIVWYQRARVDAELPAPPPEPVRESVVRTTTPTDARTASKVTARVSPEPARATSTDVERTTSTDTARGRPPIKPKPAGGSPEFLAELGLLDEDEGHKKP